MITSGGADEKLQQATKRGRPSLHPSPPQILRSVSNGFIGDCKFLPMGKLYVR